MDALLLAVLAIGVVLGLADARDRPPDILREGRIVPNAEPLVDVARGPTSFPRPVRFDVMQAGG
eukprot:11663227-Alexandrium_andersonii.AAC.1